MLVLTGKNFRADGHPEDMENESQTFHTFLMTQPACMDSFTDFLL